MQARTRHTAFPIEKVLDAIGSPRRRQILRLVWDSERSAGELAGASDVSWPAVSQNLRVLKQAGLVIERRAGTHRYYRADRLALGPLEVILRQMWARDLDRLRQLAEAEAKKISRRHD